MIRCFVQAGLTACCLAAGGAPPSAQQAAATIPYKLGTFAEGNRIFVGLVLNDRIVLDVSKADASLPSDMKTLLERYDALRSTLASIAASASVKKPAYAHDVRALETLSPVMPQNLLNAAVNYVEHAQEMQGRGVEARQAVGVPASIPGIWLRRPDDTRHNPYVFVKPVGAVVGNGHAIRIPPGRERVDWECELSIVVGRTATAVSVERARDYIVGYTLQNDVSDRGGRADNRHGSDWFIGKGHDTFAPLGPYIVPKEFVTDPQKLGITFTLNGQVMQDSSTERMTASTRCSASYRIS